MVIYNDIHWVQTKPKSQESLLLSKKHRIYLITQVSVISKQQFISSGRQRDQIFFEKTLILS
jgi:hypothetical protein